MEIRTWPKDTSVIVEWKDETGEHCEVRFGTNRSDEFLEEAKKAVKLVGPKGEPNE